MKKICFVLLLAASLSVGCLEKETTQTIYLEADGSVTWEVIEADVYSSSEKPEDRAREEAEYLAMARANQAEVALAMTEIGATEVRTQLLRDRRPFRLRVTGRFLDLGQALSGFFTAVEVDARITLESNEGVHVLTITPSDLESGLDGEDRDGPILELLRSEGIRILMSNGEFESAEGFCLQSGSRVAVLDGDCEPDEEEAREERFRLVWHTEP